MKRNILTKIFSKTKKAMSTGEHTFEYKIIIFTKGIILLHLVTSPKFRVAILGRGRDNEISKTKSVVAARL